MHSRIVVLLMTSELAHMTQLCQSRSELQKGYFFCRYSEAM